MKNSTIRYNSQGSQNLTALELEKTQLALVQSCRMHRHEQLKEYAMFCTEFYRYCEHLQATKNRWSPDVSKWVKILAEYSRLFMFPQEYISWVHLGRQNHSLDSLQVALKGCKSWLHDEMMVLRSEETNEDLS